MQNQQEGISQKVSQPSGDRQFRENTGHRYYDKLVRILGADDMLDSFKNFDRQRLTAVHNKARLYLTHPQVGKILHMNDEHEEEYRSSHEATESANELVPVSLKDLKIGERNEGVVLFGELCVEAFKFVRIYTLLNEVGTGNAVALSIVSPIPSSIDQSFPRCTYPQGRKIAVKEPLLVQGEGGILFINVGNPLSIETTESLPASADINVTVGEEKFNRWKECADKALITNDWKKCVRYATKCLSCLSQGMPVDRSIVIHMFVLRWQAYLNLCRYQEALADAEKCYELNNSELTPIISSLLSVGRYKKAFQLLENSYALFPEQKDNLVEVYRRCGSLYFEISEAILQLGLRNPNVLKPDADFIGPVEIRMTRNGCNRGLFATEDIEEGQVLLLSKGLAMSGRPMKDQNALLQNVKDALASCGETTRQFFLSHGMKGLSHFIPKMSDFITGSAVGYPVNWATVSQKYYKLAEKEKNRKILLILNCIALDDSCPAAMQENCKESVISSDVPARLYYGVWLLPSFINHSCLPNAARINVGEIQRIHATRKISKDKEITIPYFNVFVPYPSRQRSSAAFGFSCDPKPRYSVAKPCKSSGKLCEFSVEGEMAREKW
ncbi:hypothetical protein SUGI_0114810 [Cryptomeria japonica]|nr:hypothetical protein SUGI_0114810 [Cryptomeria japonica]